MGLVRRLLRDPFGAQSIVFDFSEFSGIPINTVIERIARYHALNADDWNEHAGTDASFYIDSQNYIYDTLSANANPQQVVNKLNRFNPRILDAIRKRRGQSLLDFGAGCGAFCEVAHRMGLKATYIDLPGLVFDFAKWRFEKLGIPVPMIEASSDPLRLTDHYDIIYSDGVFTSFTPEGQLSTAAELTEHLNRDSLLILLIGEATPDKPMLHKVDFPTLHQQLARSGLVCDFGLQRGISMWRRKLLPDTQ